MVLKPKSFSCMEQLIESRTLVTLTPNVSSINDNNNKTADCFNSSWGGTEVNANMLLEMKAYSPGLLILYCIVNMSLGFLSFVGNALVVLTVLSFSELHIVTNIGLASLSTATFFQGSILHSFLLAIGFSVLINGCPLFQKSSFAIFYLSHVFLYNYIFHLCLVTVERYIGVVFPLRYHTIISRERVVKLFAGSWITSFLFSVPHAINNSVAQSSAKATWICTIVFALTFSLYCNIKVYHISRRHKRQIMTQTEVVQQMSIANQERFRGARTVLYVMVTLLACYVPALIIRCIQSLVDSDKLGTLVLIKPWTSTFFVMYSGISPFVYFFRSRKLRRYSRKLIRKTGRLMRQYFLK